MTAPGPAAAPAQPADNTHVDIKPNVSTPGKPMVVLTFTTGATEFVLKLDARNAAQFGLQLGQGIAGSAQAALAQAGPQIITPNGGSGGLFLPSSGRSQ